VSVDVLMHAVDLSHKQHGHHAFTISGYTLAEQKVSNQQLIKVSLLWQYM